MMEKKAYSVSQLDETPHKIDHENGNDEHVVEGNCFAVIFEILRLFLSHV